MFSNRKSYHGKTKIVPHGKRKKEIWKQFGLFVFAIGLILVFLILDSVIFSAIHCFKFPSSKLQVRISLVCNFHLCMLLWGLDTQPAILNLDFHIEKIKVSAYYFFVY